MSLLMTPHSPPRDRCAGTRFRLYPQYDEGLPAELVQVSSPAGSLSAGPSDDRMYVANAIRKACPYDPPAVMPPYPGPVYPPAVPDRDGHFDWIPQASPQFRAAHVFGTVRFVLDIFETAFGQQIAWWHPDAPPRVELVPAVLWQNAQSGPGFLETGFWPGEGGEPQPFCLNFDVIAHEVGHEILFGRLGVPLDGTIDGPFLAVHEFFGDMVALLGALFFASVRRRLLQQTGGNLYVLNLVNRLAETASHQQIRMASNAVTMDQVAGLQPLPDGTWFDPLGLGRNAHDLSAPLMGATFDILVELYQEGLAARRAITPAIDARYWSRDAASRALHRVGLEHTRALARFAAAFDEALVAARDAVLHALVHMVRTVTAPELDFPLVAARMLEAFAVSGVPNEGPRGAPSSGPGWTRLLACFLDRGIDPRPYLSVGPLRQARSVRPSRRGAVLVASRPRLACPCRDPRLQAAARRLMPHLHRAA